MPSLKPAASKHIIKVFPNWYEVMYYSWLDHFASRPASNFQRRFAMFRDVMRVKTSAREGSREVYILREVS